MNKKRLKEMSSEMKLSGSVKKGLELMVRSGIEKAIRECSVRYGFSVEEALEMLNLEIEEKKENRVKSNIPLPFLGEVKEGCCHGLRQNHGLLTQCEMKVKEGVEYCLRCEKECKKNGSGKPDRGNIEDRLAAWEEGKEYRDPKGRAPIAYAKVMEKLKLTESMVKEEALRCGVVLKDSDLKMEEKKRGRPKKEKVLTTDTDSEVSKKKGRGRPKKEGKEVELKKTEDLFATLISEAKKSEKKEEEKEEEEEEKEEEKEEEEKEEEEEDSDEEEAVITVKRFEFKGKKYLRTSDNVLYDADTQECVGVFNEKCQEIEECESDDEEEEE